MHKRPGASQRASSLQSTAFSVRRKQHPCTTHLSLSISHRRRPDTALTHVANCEKPLTFRDPHEDDDGAIVQVVNPTTQPTSRDALEDDPPLGEQLENLMSFMWVCTAIMGAAFLVLALTYGWIDAMTETQLLIAASIPFFWSWINRFRALRFRFGSIISMAIRLGLMATMLLTHMYQIRTFILMYDRTVFALGAIATGLTLTIHWLLGWRDNPMPMELKPMDMDLVAPFLSDNVEAVEKVSARLSLAWVFVSGVVLIPFVQEIMFRGVVAISLGHSWSGLMASMLAAMVFQLSQPIDSSQRFLTMMGTQTVWGLVIMMSGGNLMYSYVAHMMHNAVLMGVYYYETLIQSW